MQRRVILVGLIMSLAAIAITGVFLSRQRREVPLQGTATLIYPKGTPQAMLWPHNESWVWSIHGLEPKSSGQSSDGTPAKLLDQFDEPVQKMTAGQAGCVGLMVLPLVLAVGTMRWNITATLDADLAKVLTWFCDTVSIFRLLTPLAYVKTENKLIQSFWRSASTKVVLLAYAFQVLKVVGLIVGALIAFHYLLSMLFSWMFGK